MKKSHGFTIVEIIVTVMVISVLTSITVIAYNQVQQDARDTTRRGNVAIISAALEKYYEKNGEYPSVRSLANNYVGNTGTVVATKLSISAEALKMPKMPTGATNGIMSGATPTNNYVTYIAASADSTDNTACQSNISGGCEEFTLKYILEKNNATSTVESHHKIPTY